MNYMLLENETLLSMKEEHCEYIKSNKPDPAPHKWQFCHSDMITCIIIIPPEDPNLTPEQYKHKLKYATSSRDGWVKIWMNGRCVTKIQVTKDSTGKSDPSKKIWVTCITYMTLSKRLVAASANRMISFYDLEKTGDLNQPTSRIEGMVGVPFCLEYYQWPKNGDNKLESLLVGDDLGIIHLYNFVKDKEEEREGWHWCEYKVGSSNPNECHRKQIEADYRKKVEKKLEDDKKER